MKSVNKYIVNTNAINHNLNEYKKIDNKSKICAVVKADAYGIGIENVVSSIDKEIDFYAVACISEAEKLRKQTSKSILILNYVDKNNINFCSKNNISISVENISQIKQLAKLGHKIKIHLAINSGMNRLGFSTKSSFFNAMQLLQKHKNQIIIEGIFTHFYDGKNHEKCKKQFDIFMQYLNILKLYFDDEKILKHTCSSVPAVLFDEFRLDMVRLGILLYGSNLNLPNIKPKQVLKIESKIVSITKTKKGDAIGYSNGFVCSKKMTIGTIPLGYADGIFRSYSKKGYVLCGKTKCKIVGNICMDMLMIDLTNTNAKIGDKVILVGKTKNNEITVDDFAKKCKTISYEVLTNIKKTRMDIITKY